MGLFDRLFGRKKKEEIVETPAVEEAVQEEAASALPEAEAGEAFPEIEEVAEAETESVLESPVVEADQEGEMVADSTEQVVTEEEVESDSETEAEVVPISKPEAEAVPADQPTSSHQAIADQAIRILEEETPAAQEDLAEAELTADPLPAAAASEDLANDEAQVEESQESEEPVLAHDIEAAEETWQAPASENEETQVEETAEVPADQDAQEILGDESEVSAETMEETASEEAAPALQESEQDKYDRSLKKTRKGFGARLNAFFANFRTVDEDFFEELEELLILSDVGVSVATNLVEDLRYEAKLENAKKPDALRRVIIEKLVDIYEKDGQFNETLNLQADAVTVMLFVGVNGVGKTTSIGKLAYKYKQEGKKVMLVAADTFRAGAVAQLEEWARRVDVPIVTGPEKSDPASVVYDGVERAVAEGVDILLIDTAGRLQNKDNLMAELEKIGRIIKRVIPEAPHETLLALDASTGQNALVQAKEFSKITPVTGIVLTKIDGTARGGVVLAIRQELDIPVKLIGFGEKIDDIGAFHSEEFMRGLLDGLI